MDVNAVLEVLEYGDHVCSPIRSVATARAVAATSTRSGLRNGQKMLFFTSDPALRDFLRARVEGAAAAMERHQLQLIPSAASYLPDGVIDPQQLVETLDAEIDLATHQGYPGLRVTGDLSQITTFWHEPEPLLEYEALVNSLFATKPVIAICHHDPDAFAPATWTTMVATHPSTVIPDGDAYVSQLRVIRTSTGLQLTGEADLANHHALPQLIRANLAMDGPGDIDATQLRFADARALGCLLRAVKDREGHRTIIRCQPHIAECLALLGAGHLAHLTVTIVGSA